MLAFWATASEGKTWLQVIRTTFFSALLISSSAMKPEPLPNFGLQWERMQFKVGNKSWLIKMHTSILHFLAWKWLGSTSQSSSLVRCIIYLFSQTVSPHSVMYCTFFHRVLVFIFNPSHGLSKTQCPSLSPHTCRGRVNLSQQAVSWHLRNFERTPVSYKHHTHTYELALTICRSRFPLLVSVNVDHCPDHHFFLLGVDRACATSLHYSALITKLYITVCSRWETSRVS